MAISTKCVKKCTTKPRKSAAKKTTTKPRKSVTKKTTTKPRKSVTKKTTKPRKSVTKKTATKSRKSASKKACDLPAKRYTVLKCNKVSAKKPVSAQGKTITMKCTSTAAAGKYATAVYRKTSRSLKTVYLYRKGKVTKFSIVFRRSATTGKKVAKATSVKKMDVKIVKSSTPCRKSRKPLTKRCPAGSQKSKSKKTCLKRLGTHSRINGGSAVRPTGIIGTIFGPAVQTDDEKAEVLRRQLAARKAIAQRDADEKTLADMATAAEKSRRFAAAQKAIAQRDADEKTLADMDEKKRRFAAAQKAIGQRDADEATMAAIAEKKRRFAAAQKAIGQRDAAQAATDATQKAWLDKKAWEATGPAPFTGPATAPGFFRGFGLF